MQVISQKWVFRSDLQNNPDIMYLFGDNKLRKGMGGQAKEMRGEPNAIGVATKLSPTSGSNAFFSDDDFEANCASINFDLAPVFRHLAAGGSVVIPTDGLGTGLSELLQRAPQTNAYLTSRLQDLELV